MRIIRCCSSYKSTVVTTEYTIEYFTADIGVDEYIERFRDEARFIELCEKCPNFGCSWGCPPFDFDTDEFLRQYKYAHLMATKIIPDRNDIPVEMTQEFISDLFSTLRERMIDLQYCKVVFVGGGAILLKRQIETAGKVGAPFFVPKINANADGYEYLYRIETAGR